MPQKRIAFFASTEDARHLADRVRAGTPQIFAAARSGSY